MGISGISSLHGGDGVFPHKCKHVGCKRVVEFDDEPYCFEHSPDEGSDLPGYSARAEAESAGNAILVNRNVFEDADD